MQGAVWDVTEGLPMTSLMEITDFTTFVEGLDHPEGVAAGPDGELYAGGEAGQIYQVTLEGQVNEVAATGGFHLGLCLDGNSNVYVCDSAAHAVKRVYQSGKVEKYSLGTAARPMVTPNYPVFDASGNLFVSDSGAWKQNDGCIYVIRPGGETEIFTDAVRAFPNGMALHPDGKRLYCVISQLSGVVSVDIESRKVTTVATLPHNIPDGLAFDEDGNLYICCYTPDVIYRLEPDGVLNVLAADWESIIFATPTNIAFCGADRLTMVVGSLSRWHLAKGTMSIPGARLNYPML